MVPPPDVFPCFTVKPLYEPASDDALIGGDFNDIFAVGDGRVALADGGATGKGLEAATYTAEIKFALRIYLRESPSSAEARRRLNRFLVDKERLDPVPVGGSYASLSVCVVDTRSGEIGCSWGGIEPPFVLRAKTGEVVELMETSEPLLGVDVGSVYREQRITLDSGDVLAMSTDGLTESRRGRGKDLEFFGYDDLVSAVRDEVANHPRSGMQEWRWRGGRGHSRAAPLVMMSVFCSHAV